MKLHLPSGKVVEAEAPLDEALPLGDAHVVIAVQKKLGVREEEEIEISCVNCEAAIRLKPCAHLPIAPWVDGEANDPELDVTLPFGEPHAIPPVKLGRVRVARTVTLRPLTYAESKTSLGIEALGRERDPKAIEAAFDGDFSAIADVWLESHYVPRLTASIVCKACGARNDVPAPFDRELESPSPEPHDERFPSFDEWDQEVHRLASPWPDDLLLVTDAGPPFVDAGGDPVWGVFEEPGGFGPPKVTLYYRTFEAEWREGAYDWRAEIEETIEHELEHYEAFHRGHDAMAEEEEATLADEAERVIGRAELRRRATRELGSSVADFWKRTWLLWVLVAIATALVVLSNRD